MREHPVHLSVLRREHLPLLVLAADLVDISGELKNGRGFVVIRGLPFGKYDGDDIARIFWGIGTHLGYPISQNTKGDLLGHVREIEGLQYMDKNVRGYRARSGKLRALAVTSAKRSIAVPDIPTVVESGYPDYVVVGWAGVFAPARVPRTLPARINADINRALAGPDTRQRLLASGSGPASMTNEEFGG